MSERKLKVALSGASGMLGRSLLRESDVDWLPLPASTELDIRDRSGVRLWMTDARPDVVLHTAAMTAVDRCESAMDLAFEVNRDGTQAIVDACAEVGARCVYVSTDYVFNGSGNKPWQPQSPTEPINVYGASKLAGEHAVHSLGEYGVIARVSWLFGPGGPSFLHTMAKLGAGCRGTGKPLRVVDDQFGAPTSTRVLAPALVALAMSRASGVYHLAPRGFTSWYEFALLIFELLGYADVVVEPCDTREFPRPAPRPANSRLDSNAFNQLGLFDMGSWDNGVRDFIMNYREELNQ